MNELTRTITLSSGVQARVSENILVDSLEGTIAWEYDPIASPLMIMEPEGVHKPEQCAGGKHKVRSYLIQYPLAMEILLL
jgi:hypothetical protein